jgi:phospholipid/cholesterol/gamma-HCH transport system substrate-binding protein
LVLKYGKEFKIGLVSLVVLLSFIWILNFIKGYNLFNPNDYYYAVYPTSGGLQTGRPVKINGVRVGIVSDISFFTGDLSRVVVKFEVDKDYQFSKNSIAEIAQGEGLMSDVEMKIVLLPGDVQAVKGDTLTSRMAGGMTDAIFAAINPIKDQLTATLATMDSVLKDIHDVLNDSTRENLSRSVASLSVTLKNMEGITQHTESLLEKNKDHFSSIAQNTAASIEKLNAVIDTASLSHTLKDLEKTMAQLNAISSQIASGEGTIGGMIYDEKLYQNLSQATSSLGLLIEDIKEHPKKYINVTVFGKKERTEKKMVKDSLAAERLRAKASKK